MVRAPADIAVMDPSALSPQPEPDSPALRAVAELLLDSNPRVYEPCAERLRGYGRRALAVLRAIEECDDPEARVRVRRLVRRIELDIWQREHLGSLKLRAVDLEEAWIELGSVAGSELDGAGQKRRLDLYAALLAPRLRRRGPRALAEQFRDFFQGELGFDGNRDCYDHPDNCFLHRVLARRRGMPAALCALYLLVARRVGVEIEPVALPGHFLLRFPGTRPVYLDPFNSGRVLTRKACLRKLRELGYGYHASCLQRSRDEDVLMRILSNLVHTLGLLGRLDEADVLRRYRGELSAV